MTNIDDDINVIDANIFKNIETATKENKGFIAQNLLAQIRNLVEHVALKYYYEAGNEQTANEFNDIKKAVKFVGIKHDTNFILKFHNMLQKSASHYTKSEQDSERLLLKYYEYLIKIKKLLETSGLSILKNIELYPKDNNMSLNEYYNKIYKKVYIKEKQQFNPILQSAFYVIKSKPIFLEDIIFYEITFTRAIDNNSKFDRIIGFSNIDIPTNYAVRLSLRNESINTFKKIMPIVIIDEWEASIRPCEINNFSKIFGIDLSITNRTAEFIALNNFVTLNKLSLFEIVILPDNYYQKFVAEITSSSSVKNIVPLLDKCRYIIYHNKPGNVVIRYLLYNFKNKIIKNQYYINKCTKLSNLKLSWGCNPFEAMPFNSSLIGHNPRYFDLIQCIELDNREHEFLGRTISSNTEIEGNIYTPIRDLDNFENIEELISTYNDKVYTKKHAGRKLEIFSNYLYIKDYQNNTLKVVKELKTYSNEGVGNYQASVESWLKKGTYDIDCNEKKSSLKEIFAKSKVAFVYGAAGTGKTTFINHVSHFFNDKTKMFLANTNPAVDNLRRKIDVSNSSFKTVSSYLHESSVNQFDLLIIDESSTISNRDMLDILKKRNFQLLLLVGDVFQIESIKFGNWFDLCGKTIIPKTAVINLEKPYRTSDLKLLDFWKSVRDLNDDILEHLTRNSFSSSLDESIFKKRHKDEIILCLNYDGLYGINNINKFLQKDNPSKEIIWGLNSFKTGDPILFNENERFKPVIYNNLKGIIKGIKLNNDSIIFDIEINKVLNELDVEGLSLELIRNTTKYSSIIRFEVNKSSGTDYDNDDSDSIIPFQVAYATSIHKSQGLEYNSVKIVITDEVDELITPNLFYTAVTRTKNALKIYWTPETENKILSSFKKKPNNDIGILKSKMKNNS